MTRDSAWIPAAAESWVRTSTRPPAGGCRAAELLPSGTAFSVRCSDQLWTFGRCGRGGPPGARSPRLRVQGPPAWPTQAEPAHPPVEAIPVAYRERTAPWDAAAAGAASEDGQTLLEASDRGAWS